MEGKGLWERGQDPAGQSPPLGILGELHGVSQPWVLIHKMDI